MVVVGGRVVLSYRVALRDVGLWAVACGIYLAPVRHVTCEWCCRAASFFEHYRTCLHVFVLSGRFQLLVAVTSSGVFHRPPWDQRSRSP